MNMLEHKIGQKIDSAYRILRQLSHLAEELIYFLETLAIEGKGRVEVERMSSEPTSFIDGQ